MDEMKPLPDGYTGVATPQGYECSACGAMGCKLWRQYNTFLDHIELLCAPCAAKDQKADIASLDADGRLLSSIFPPQYGQRTDQIGSLIPAVPTEDGSSFWGYTSVPEPGCVWWRRLPTLPSPVVSA